jgi:alanine racemase
MYDTFIEISKLKLIQNILNIKSFVNKHNNHKIQLCVPVKANAYGHDICLVSRLLEPYVDYFAVALISEAIMLRNITIKKPILVFGAYTDSQVEQLVNNNIEITISSMHKAKLINEYCLTNNKYVKVHIKIDTGMSRVGVKPNSAEALIDYVFYNCHHIQLIGVYSHFANSEYIDDPITQDQIDKFDLIVKYVKSLDNKIICHLANSGGVLNYPNSYYDMVRPGILCYGYMPDKNSQQHELFYQILPVFSLKSHISYFKVVKEGTGISYNHVYRTSKQSRIVTIPVGYGDGYRRALSNLGSVIIRNKLYTISGNICMDMFMVDIGTDEAYVGDEVLLIGSDGVEQITIEEIAKICDTISYEILCGFNIRIPRILVE